MTTVLTPQEIVWRMCCSVCHQSVHARADGLHCPDNHLIPLQDGYLNALVTDTSPTDGDTTRTASSFGYEWNRFGTIQSEDSKFWGDLLSGRSDRGLHRQGCSGRWLWQGALQHLHRPSRACSRCGRQL